MWGIAALTALISTVFGFALACVPVAKDISSWYESSYYSRSSFDHWETRRVLKVNAIVAVIAFVVLLFVDWLFYFKERPVFAGAGWVGMVVVNLIILLIAFGIVDGFRRKVGLASAGSLVIVVVLSAGVVGIWNNWYLGQGNVDKLTHALNVKMVPTNPKDPAGNYPPTSDDHMVIVGDQAARNQANRAMNTKGISTRYDLGDGELQSVAGHMYYLFDLKVTGVKNSGAVQYTSPGYIAVDAEDPNAAPEAKLGYKIHYFPGGTYQANLERYLYNNGFRTQFIDGLSLEVDDNWQPYYTASVNDPLVRWQDSAPVGFIAVDAQTGKINRYKLDQIPAWVDRVYSRATAQHLLDAWGHWGQAPYKAINEGSANRYKLSGDLNLVYTEAKGDWPGGPAYQALFTSFKSDTAVRYVALMSTRSNQVFVYEAPAGLQVESNVKEAFNQTVSTTKKFDPTALALHKIYGQLTWVASMVGDGQGDKSDDNGTVVPTSFAGVGVINATQADSSKAIIGRDKGDALSQYSTQIATGSNNNAPGANAQEKTLQGKLASVSPPLVFNGNTYMILTLEGDNAHLYRGQVTETATSLSMTVAKVGDQVTIKYIDTGGNNPIRNIASFQSASLAGVN
jgi:hypothetical protein